MAGFLFFMKEIEIKIALADRQQTLEILKNNGCNFGDGITQDDTVYIPEGQSLIPVPPGVPVLRIRRQGNKSLFTLKQSDPDNHLSKLEHELEITDPDAMDKIIRQLGFKIVAHIVKDRVKSNYKDYEICVDHVHGLGDFLEIEQLSDDDPVVIQKGMMEFLEKLKIDTSQRLDVGYDILFIRKQKS